MAYISVSSYIVNPNMEFTGVLQQNKLWEVKVCVPLGHSPGLPALSDFRGGSGTASLP